MEKERKIRKLALVAVIVAVLGMTIAFAALSQTLNITGTSKMEPAEWGIYFDNLSVATTKGKAKDAGTAQITNNGLTIDNIEVTLSVPGDTVEYTVDLVNSGTINAEIEDFIMPTLTDEQKEIIEFKAIYREDNKEVSIGDVLPGKTKEPLTIVVRYKDITDASLLPEEAQSIHFSYEIKYIQTDKTGIVHAGNTEEYELSKSRYLLKSVDVSENGDESVMALFYSDDTITIQGEGKAKSDLSGDTLKFENTELIPFYKRVIEASGYDASNINSLEDIEIFFETIPEEEQEEASNKLEQNMYLLMYKDALEELGYENLDSIEDVETLMTYMKENGLMDEDGNLTEKGEEFNNRAGEKENKLNEVNYSADEVVLEEGITNVPKGVYTGNEEITNVKIPSTVTKIEDEAFYDCTGITKVVIPSTVTEIGNSAFQNCTNLEEITISEVSNVETMSLKQLASTNNSRITSIGDNAFYNCVKLKNINNLISNVTSLGYGAFSNCTGITKLTINANLTSVNAFTDVTNLEEVNITGNGTVGSSFSYSNVKKITLSDKITSIGSYAFSGCTSLTSITIPNGVTSIGSYAFSGCTGLTNLTIPTSVTSIGEWVFSNCNNLTKLTIPANLTNVYAFSGVTNLEEVNITGTGAMPNYNTTYRYTPWYISRNKIKKITISDGITSIGEWVFSNCTGLTSITIPTSVTSIGSYAFSGCTGLTSVTLENGVTSIGSGAFSGCTSLTSITIPNGVTSIGERAFSGCTGLTNLTIPTSVTSIGNRAFYGCTGLTSITIPNSIASVGSYAFSNWTSSQTINIDNTSSYVSSNWVSGWNDGSSATINYLRD